MKINIEKIKDDLIQLDSIAEKLKYWEAEIYPIYEYTNGYWDDNLEYIPDPIFEDLETDAVQTLLRIPKELHDEHFNNGHLNTEYCYWFLKFNAKHYCKHALIPDFEEKCNNPLKSDFILAELRELKQNEEQATKLFLNKDFDIYNKGYDLRYENHKILKRIQSNYYQNNRFDSVHAFGSKTTIIYSKHIYFKSYLIEELKKSNPTEYLDFIENKQISSFESILLRILQDLSIKPSNFEKEDDLRSHFYYILSALREDLYVTIESISRNGRSDLLILGEYGRIIIEFKIWKRNNYQEITNQIIGYLSDFENEGFIIIYNKNQKLIDEDYIKIISDTKTSIIGNVDIIQYKNTAYRYYKSIHQPDLKPKKITHFIYNKDQ